MSAFLNDAARSVFVAAQYTDRATGLIIPVKILVDAAPHPAGEFAKMLGDVKTAASAHPGAWSRKVFEQKYHVQAALYLDVWASARPAEDRTDFAHLIQENYHPFQPAHRILSGEFIELGRMKYQNALARYAKCLASGIWPGYDDDQREHWNGWPFTHPEPWMLNAA